MISRVLPNDGCGGLAEAAGGYLISTSPVEDGQMIQCRIPMNSETE